MRIVSALSILVSSLWMVGVSMGASESDKAINLRVAAYNVEFGRSTTPEQVGKMFKPYDARYHRIQRSSGWGLDSSCG